MRVAARGAAPPRIDIAAWTVDKDSDGYDIRFLAQAPLAITSPSRRNLVIALGRISRPIDAANQTYAIAFSRDDGETKWETPVANPVADSNAGITVDPEHDTVIVCSGNKVTALRLYDGEVVWQRQLSRDIIDANPVITNDLGPADRLFITDADGLGSTAKLYCINVDECDSVLNPFQPGEIVWSAPLGASVGNSPAYLPACQGGAGLVYVASPAPGGYGNGVVRAFVAADNSPNLAWQTANPEPISFFGGVSVAPPTDTDPAPRVYVASYAFIGNLNSANLLSLNGLDGSVVWSVASNRSSSVPMPLPDRRVLLSSGINGYGSASGVELFQETSTESQTSVARVWNTVVSTWIDLDGDGEIDLGEFLSLGGWRHQPALLTADGRNLLVVGVPAESLDLNGPGDGLYILDIDKGPSSEDFIVACSSATAAGGSPGIAGVSMASIGSDGLAMFGATPARLDVNRNKTRTIDDLYVWEAGFGDRDVNRDHVTNEEDRRTLIRSLRPTWPQLNFGVLP